MSNLLPILGLIFAEHLPTTEEPINMRLSLPLRYSYLVWKAIPPPRR
jgi:hypothetical protein